MRYSRSCWASTGYVFLGFLSLSESFQNTARYSPASSGLRPAQQPFNFVSENQISVSTALSSHEDDAVTKDDDRDGLNTVSELNDEIDRRCQAGQVDDALKLLQHAEERLSKGETNGPFPNESSYTTIMLALAGQDGPADPDRLEGMLKKMKDLSRQYPACKPVALTYNAVILAWSKAAKRDSGEQCDKLLKEVWARYTETGDAANVPIKASYVSTLAAWASSGKGKQGAERAEVILEEMETLRIEHPHLAPTTICANIVLNAWSKSGTRGAGQRCETILARIEELYFDGRSEIKPSTTSFNTVIDALARSREHGSEQRAEALLEHMDELSSTVDELEFHCQPDNTSFNTVLNCWARSRAQGAPRRAEAILRHMERRFVDGNTDIQPDAAAYNTVLTAWARSRANDRAERAEQVLLRMEDAAIKNNMRAKPNAISYNIFINVLAKSDNPRASDIAEETLNKMKGLASVEGREDARPDVFTYTSLLDALAKRGSVEAAKKALSVLEELEASYDHSGDRALKPNIRTYTSVVHAIARSRVEPERAEQIVNRLEELYESGDGDILPDVVCYDALINAYGWSTKKGKALKCFEIYQTMLRLHQSRQNVDAKPDIITCNSVLNACAFDQAETTEENEAIMDVAIQTLEHFQSNAPKFGRPNHISFANTLLAIDKHLPAAGPDDNGKDKRSDLAETTFWQCCQSGCVSVLVVKYLDLVLPFDRLSTLLGPALFSTRDERLRFGWRQLPREWTQYAPPPKERRDSRPSKRRAAVAVTKSAMASRRKESNP